MSFLTEGNNSGPNLTNQVVVSASQIYIPVNGQQSEIQGVFASQSQTYSKSDADRLLALKANTTDVNNSLALKANASDMTAAQALIALKANSADVITSLGLKANTTDVNNSLALKANAINLINVANTKPSDLPISNATQAALDLKSNYVDVSHSLQNKADLVAPSFLGLVRTINQLCVGSSGLVPSATALYVSGNTQITGNLLANGYLASNQLKLLGVTNAIGFPVYRGYLVHPNVLNLSISSAATPASDENQLIIQSNGIFCNNDLLAYQNSYVNNKCAVGYDLSVFPPTLPDTTSAFYVNGSANIQGNLTISGKLIGVPLPTPAQIGLGNVANTAPSDLPVSNATQAALNLKADITTVYTKTQTDTSLSNKADSAWVYQVEQGLASKANQTDFATAVQTIAQKADSSVVSAALALKADSISVYTKPQNDAFLALKADSSNVYTKFQSDTSLALKADASNVYSKAEHDASLLLKADASNVYTKAQQDASLALKANIVDLYYKLDVDNALALKANAVDLVAAQATLALKANSADVNTSLMLKANLTDVYTKTQEDANLALKANTTDVNNSLALKANINSPSFTGYIQTNKIQLLGISTGTFLTESGYLNHPSRLILSTSSASPPASADNAIMIMGGIAIYNLKDTMFNANVYANNQLTVGGANGTVGTSLFVSGNTTLNGNLTITGTTTGIPIPTLASLGLSNVANTAPSDLPVSNATLTALSLKANMTDVYYKSQVDSFLALKASATQLELDELLISLKANSASPTFTGTVYSSNQLSVGSTNAVSAGTSLFVSGNTAISGNLTVTGTVSGIPTPTLASLGLSNVANTAPSDLPVSNATQAALNLKANIADVYYKSQVDSFLALKASATQLAADELLISLKANSANPTFTGTVYSSNQLSVGSTSAVAAATSLYVSGNTTISGNLAITGTVSGIPTPTLASLGLSNVANTAPSDLPVSNATQAALNLKANLANPSFTGNANVTGWLYAGGTQNTAPTTLYVSGSTAITGSLGVGTTTTPTSALQVSGLLSSAPTTGINLGMNPSSTNNAVVCINAGSSSASCYIGFTSTGQAFNHNGYIQYSNNSNQFFFYTYQGLSMMMDGSTANNTVLIGTSSSQTAYKLYVNGAAYATSLTAPTISCTTSLSCSGTKNFDISHPLKEGYRLRHRCIEGPKAYLFYQFQYSCNVGFNEFPMPDYFDAMNTDVLVYVSPFRCFGTAYGETDKNTLIINCSIAGTYNIQVVGTRNDQICQDDWNKYGVEYQEEISQ